MRMRMRMRMRIRVRVRVRVRERKMEGGDMTKRFKKQIIGGFWINIRNTIYCNNY